MLTIHRHHKASQRAALLCVATAVLGSIGCSSKSATARGSNPDASTLLGGRGNADLADASFVVSRPDGNLSAPMQRLLITPGDVTITVDPVNPESISFSASLPNGEPSALDVRWSVSHRNIGEIDADSGIFTPNGAGGSVAVTARSGGLTGTATVLLVVSGAVDGDPDSDGLPEGAGGIGGVGGDGGGTKLGDPKLREALDMASTADPELVWLYPYDQTVWPRGLPAPLVMWRSARAAEAVKLRVEVADAYDVSVYLGRPARLPNDQPIVRLPIPQAVWRNALLSGAQMKVTLTIAARDDQGALHSYSAQDNPTWKVAPTTLRGVVYYNSYATKLVENYSGGKGGNGRFGGATLAVHGGSFDPVLVAGETTPDNSGCRVCHVVASGGSVLIAQQDRRSVSSRYDLRNANMETVYPPPDNGKFAFAALSADGELALGNSGPPGNEPNASLPQSGLYRVADGSVLNAPGLSEFVKQATTPAFAHDLSKVVFNLFTGPGSAEITADGHSLVTMDINKVDATTYSFSNPKALFTTQGEQRPAWPYFLPDGSGVVFQIELRSTVKEGLFVTSQQARGELWWSDLDGQAHALDRANGKGYLPRGPLAHDDDATLQYEPTVAPLVAGGYAWAVFTSRRLYGNVATREPFESEPRVWDLSPDNPAGPTTKKLWVTALDMPAKPGTDPSHPAFYLPAQELYAGNMRGFWVLDACKPDLAECTGGDECCNGFCRRDVENLSGVCMDVPDDACAMEYDKCNVTADCCITDGRALHCVAGRCALMVDPG